MFVETLLKGQQILAFLARCWHARPCGWPRQRACLFLLAILLVAVPSRADEGSASRRFELARRDEPSLIAFLRTMPKGGDLHSHPGGAIYAEDVIDYAIKQGLFFDPATSRFQRQRTESTVPADQLLRDDRLRSQFLDATSVRGGRVGPAGGHDHFFRTFGLIGSGLQGMDAAELIAIIARRARLQNIQYLELSEGIAGEAMGRVQAALLEGEPVERMLNRLKPLFTQYVAAARSDLDRRDRIISERLGATEAASAASGALTIRYLLPTGRIASPERVAVTLAAGFSVMRTDSRVVGINLAAPEDHPVALRQFRAQMSNIGTLWSHFERPNITLHAGELNLFLSPLEDLTHHIRDSIEVAHARRIGHGTSIAWEDNVEQLLRKMREERIAVEVCPSSEAVILNAEGDRHPFRMYHRAGVPLTINTDDEGILRSNLTMEFVRAVRSWDLSYLEVKELVRNSLEYSFLPGESLYENGDYRHLRPAYRALARRGWVATPKESKLLAASDKATVQVRLERALVEFEK